MYVDLGMNSLNLNPGFKKLVLLAVWLHLSRLEPLEVLLSIISLNVESCCLLVLIDTWFLEAI